MDWQRFLEENNIHFVSRGPNTKRGELSVQCPMCGDDDPSEHLGINPVTGKWGCHRDASHRGKSSRTLIKAILACSSQQAQFIVKQYSHSDPDTLESALAVLEADNNGMISHEEDLTKMAKHQHLGPQFNDFNRIKSRGITQRFYDYLERRHLDDVPSVIARYELRCALVGRYKDRIIMPVRHGGELLGWTSRAIAAVTDAPRYLASNEDVKTTVFNYDGIKAGGERLIIVEGPFDAITVDNHNFTHAFKSNVVHFRATCTFGTSPTVSQRAVLRSLVSRYDEAWVLFDRGADGPGADLAEWIGAKQAYLPSHIEDPGELKSRHLDEFVSKAFKGTFSLTWDDYSDDGDFFARKRSRLSQAFGSTIKPRHR
jgi:hypothetical protein